MVPSMARESFFRNSGALNLSTAFAQANRSRLACGVYWRFCRLVNHSSPFLRNSLRIQEQLILTCRSLANKCCKTEEVHTQSRRSCNKFCTNNFSSPFDTLDGLGPHLWYFVRQRPWGLENFRYVLATCRARGRLPLRFLTRAAISDQLPLCTSLRRAMKRSVANLKPEGCRISETKGILDVTTVGKRRLL